MHCLIGLGSNLGDRVAVLSESLDRLARIPGNRLIAASRLVTTRAAVGARDTVTQREMAQPEFLNGVAHVETSLSPEQLLAELHQLEAEFGRQRKARWDARTLDLDLLLCDDIVLRTPTLILPHSRCSFRRFVLEPAAEIAPDFRHPELGRTVSELLHHLNNTERCVAISNSLPTLLASGREPRAGWLTCAFSPGDPPAKPLPKLVVLHPADGHVFRGPTLVVDPADPAWARQELLAALEAME